MTDVRPAVRARPEVRKENERQIHKDCGSSVDGAWCFDGRSRSNHLQHVSSQLQAERITVSQDSDKYAGEAVAGPFTAYQEAIMIEKHALAATNGKTYAELDREDPLRGTAMNGYFLRASLFTSVVSFGVSALVMGVGLMFFLSGLATRSLVKV